MTLTDYLRANPAATDADVAAYSATFAIEYRECWVTERTLVGKFNLPLEQAAGLVYALYQLGLVSGNPTATDAERFTYARLYDRLVGDGLDIGTAGSHATLDQLATLMPAAAPLFAMLKSVSSTQVYPLGAVYTPEQVAAERAKVLALDGLQRLHDALDAVAGAQAHALRLLIGQLEDGEAVEVPTLDGVLASVDQLVRERMA
jgi:hypothetical protein